jgi:four helix bundle protein
MDADQLKARTRAFALDVIDLCLSLGNDDLARLIRPQLLRAGTGVATSYRAACRGRSSREFASRMATMTEESDESEFWLDVLQVRQRGPADVVRQLRTESSELRAIAAASRTTTLKRLTEERRRKSQSAKPLP